jgi:hypothetical protein
MMLSNESMVNHYQMNFLLKYHHNYSLDELDNMIPFEREIYTSMIAKQVKKENDDIKQKQQASAFR